MAFIGADDVYASDKLEKQWKKLKKESAPATGSPHPGGRWEPVGAGSTRN